MKQISNSNSCQDFSGVFMDTTNLKMAYGIDGKVRDRS